MSENRKSIYTDVDGGVFTIEVIDTDYGKIPVRKYLHKQKSNTEDMLFAKKQLKEVFEWYAEWLLTDAENPQELIKWLCDNVNPKALETIVSTYEFNNK